MRDITGHMLANVFPAAPNSVKELHPNGVTISPLKLLFERSDFDLQNENDFKRLELQAKVKQNTSNFTIGAKYEDFF